MRRGQGCGLRIWCRFIGLWQKVLGGIVKGALDVREELIEWYLEPGF